MKPISLKRHRFPADVIRHAVWLYFLFSLGFRDVEELLAQRGIDVSHETIRCWTIKFGTLIARRLWLHRQAPSPRWHLDDNRVENSHLLIRRRELQQQRFKSQASAQRFLTTHAAIYNTLNIQRHLFSGPTLRRFRAEAASAWVAAVA